MEEDKDLNDVEEEETEEDELSRTGMHIEGEDEEEGVPTEEPEETI